MSINIRRIIKKNVYDLKTINQLCEKYISWTYKQDIIIEAIYMSSEL